ncbi:MAG: glycerophosphodiester phosphodiesterase family protein, partial [Myxococcota bacterium]
VIHDSSVERTTDGHGEVKTLSDHVLDRLDAGAWKDRRYADERVPRLEALLTLLKGRTSLALEIKAPKMERAVVEALNTTGFPRSDLSLFAFDFDTLVRSLSIDPALHCTYLIDLDGLEAPDADTAWASAVQRSQDAGMSAIGPGDAGVSPSRVQQAQEAGLSVFVWTVDDARRMRELSGWGADAIMSNDVPLALKTLKGT